MTANVEFAFTGPSSLTEDQAIACSYELRQIRNSTRDAVWRSGGAHGLDTLVVLESGVYQQVKLIVPRDKQWNGELTEFIGPNEGVQLIEVPGEYRDRNTELVKGANMLHAFLKSPKFYRSGEWMTVNIATKLGVEVHIHLI